MKACFIACITGLLSAGVGVIVGPHITVYGGMVALVTYTISSYSEMHNGNGETSNDSHLPCISSGVALSVQGE